MNNNNYSLPFSDYMKNARGKFAIVITKSQYAIVVDGFTHEGMVADLIKKTRPDIEIDVWGNALNPSESYLNGNVAIVGYPEFVQLELPNSEYLSFEQFECIKNILLDIKKYNDNNHERGYGRDYELMVFSNEYYNQLANIETDYYQNKIDELIRQLEKCVSNEVKIPNEVIIGTKFKVNENSVVFDNEELIHNRVR